jgi:hypothetical protein
MLFRSWPPPNNSVTDQFRSSPKITGGRCRAEQLWNLTVLPGSNLRISSSPNGGTCGIFFFFMERVFDPSFLFFHINGSRFAVSGETGSAILYIDLD